MTASDVDDWVANIVAARRSGTRFAPSADARLSLAQAYDIQSSVARHVGQVGGFKASRKSGAAPIMAPIFSADILASGAQVPVHDRRGVELEIGFRLLADCPANLTDLTDAALARLLEPVLVIELVDTRIAGPLADDAVVKLADNQINAGLVVGPTLRHWSGSDFGTLQGTMRADGVDILNGLCTVPDGSALETLAVLSAHIGTHCGGLKQGQIVITGSLHPLTWLPPGTSVEGAIDGIGEVSVQLG